MLNVFQVFRVFGILPYRIVKNNPVFCSKWRYYSCTIGTIVACIILCQAIIYKNIPIDTTSPRCIYNFLLKWEPTFVFLHICIIYHTILNKKGTKKSIKIVHQLLKIKSGNIGPDPEAKVINYTFGTLSILLVLVFVFYFKIELLYHDVTVLNLLDYLVAFAFTAVNSIQILQLCVYYEVIIGALSRCSNDLDPIATLVEIQNLRKLKSKVEHVYYLNLIFLELNCLIYCILGFRGAYDFISQPLTSAFVSSIVVIWVSYAIPLQFYLMHLSGLIDSNVKLF